MDVLAVDHPLVKARLTVMRDARTDNATFRAALHELTVMLVYEAMRTAAVRVDRLHTPVARTEGYWLGQPPPLGPGPRPPGRPRRPPAPGATGWRPRRCWCRCCGPGSAWPTRRTS